MLKLFTLIIILFFSISSFANICEVNSFVFVPEQTESQIIFSAKFKIKKLEDCIQFAREKIHSPMLGDQYDKTVVFFYINGQSIPVEKIIMDKNYK